MYRSYTAGIFNVWVWIIGERGETFALWSGDDLSNVERGRPAVTLSYQEFAPANSWVKVPVRAGGSIRALNVKYLWLEHGIRHHCPNARITLTPTIDRVYEAPEDIEDIAAAFSEENML